jgi:hypothetical protein
MKSLILLLIAGIAVVMLEGCATSMSRSEYAVDVITNQPNARFMVYNRAGSYVHQGVTPEIVVLKAQSEFFTREKYTFKTVVDKKETTIKDKLIATISPIYWFNFVNMFGYAVDGFTGAMFALPDTINLDNTQTFLTNDNMNNIAL